MANPKKILVLDLGMQSLRVAEFSSPGGSEIRLIRGARKDFLLDPALESTRPEQIRESLREILKELKIRGGDAALVLPAHSVFTRVVALDIPGGSAGQVDAVARFEAQQNIPFPLEEVIWDHLAIGETVTGAVNVVFVAIKTDVLESICKAVSSTGLNIVSVSVAPLALYDAFRNTYPEFADSTSLLVDVGSRTTNLIFAAPGSFFTRSIPSGGLALSTAIAKEIDAELEAAEELKVTRGSVALGSGFEPPSDPIEANLARVARQNFIKTQAEITRSLGYFRTTLGGADPGRILITGGTSSMPYFAEFLQEKLNKEILFFDPLRGIKDAEAAGSPAVDFVEKNPNNIGELIGAALTITTCPCTNINLLPPSVIRKHEFSKRLPYLAGAAAVFLATLAAWGAFAMNAASATRSALEKVSSIVADEGRIAAEMQNAATKIAGIQKTTDELSALIALRQSYPALIAELSAKVPQQYLWMTEVSPAPNTPAPGTPKGQSADPSVKALIVKGLYLDNPRQAAVIDDFVTSLQSSDLFSVQEKEKSKIITQRGSPNGEFWAYPFSLNLPLRTPITPLP